MSDLRRIAFRAGTTVAVLIVLGLFVVMSSYVSFTKQRKNLHTESALDAYVNLVWQPQQQKTLLKLLKELDMYCKQKQIPYWACGGTVLGAARHKGFIPHDDDIDVCILEEFIDDLLENVPEHLSIKYTTTKHRQCLLKLRFSKGYNSSFAPAFLDIFICERCTALVDGEQKECVRFKGVCNSTFRDIWSEQEMWPLHRIPFCDTTIPVPREYLSYLDRKYIEWRNTLIVTHYHFKRDPLANLYAHLRTRFGKAPSIALTDEVQEIISDMNKHLTTKSV